MSPRPGRRAPSRFAFPGIASGFARRAGARTDELAASPPAAFSSAMFPNKLPAHSPNLTPASRTNDSPSTSGTTGTPGGETSTPLARNPGTLGALPTRTAPAGGRPRLGGLKLNMAAATAGPPGIDMAKLRQVSNGSTHFHGSRSGSLVAFHDSTPADRRGALLPMGELQDAGAAVFSGERGNSLKENAVNKTLLSVVDEKNVDGAINYATDPGLARRSPVATVAPDPFSNNTAKQELAASAEQKLKELESDPQMHQMVKDNFPVVYGLKPDAQKVTGVSSDVPGEAGVQGGVKADEIGAIFVPPEHVDSVQQLVGKVPVESLSSFKS